MTTRIAQWTLDVQDVRVESDRAVGQRRQPCARAQCAAVSGGARVTGVLFRHFPQRIQ